MSAENESLGSKPEMANFNKIEDARNFQTTKFETIIEKKSSYDFHDLRMVQDIPAHADAIWVAKISPNSKHLATGGKDAVIKVWTILGVDADDEPYSLLNKNPFWELYRHEEDILDIAWCPKSPNLLLSAGFDHKVILWNINQAEWELKIFVHPDAVPAVVFHPESDENTMIFLTACLDKSYRIWRKEHDDAVYSQLAKDHITAISISKDGARVAIGLYNGTVIVWSLDDDRLNYITSIECKNRMGKYSKGTKVTNIIFWDNTEILVTTNDSRIRIVSVEGGLVGADAKQLKFKGHKNDNLQIKAEFSEDMDFIIWGSECGYVYIWNKKHEYIQDNTKLFQTHKKERNESYEKFAPFEPEMTIPTVTSFIPIDIQKVFMHKYALCGVPKMLKHMILVTSFDGVIRVFHNAFSLSY